MSANPIRSSPLITILVAGGMAGFFDITYACVFSYLRRGATPAMVFRSVASGALGPASAREGGFKVALLGLFFHFLIALIVAGIYFFASRFIRLMITHAVFSGLLYGLCVYLVMYGLVFRFSAIHSSTLPWQYPWTVLIPNVLIHMIGIGLTIALIVRKFSKQQTVMNEVRLETERLLLRWFREDDFPAYVEIATDPEVMKFIGGAQTSFEAWKAMSSHIGHWYFRGYGVFAVEEKSTGKMIGRIGFMNPPGWPGFELGWTLSRASWGKGYATEGARRALEYAFTEMNRDHLISCIAPDNINSIKVAERLGETVEGETELLGKRVLIYGISRDQWRISRQAT